MTTQDFSNQWDVLWNNVTSNQAPGLNEYEKSVFLTKAQNQLVTEYFNNRVDQVGGGFDGSQKRQYDFSSLIKTAELDTVPSEYLETIKKIDKRSLCYAFPSDYFLAVNEILSDSKYQYNVMPISYDEYARLMLKPYAYPVKKGAWRLLTGKVPNDIVAKGTAGTSLSITYISIADNTEEPWTEFEDGAFLGEWTQSGPGGQSIVHEYVKLEEATASTQMINPYNPRYYFTYNYVPYQAEILEDGNGNYSLYIFGMGEHTMTDAQLAALLNLLLPLVLAQYSNVSATRSTSELLTKSRDSYTDFPDTFGSEVAYTIGFPIADRSLSEIIGKFTENLVYTLRYIKKPAPIVLVDLANEGYEDLEIEGVDTVSQCELPEETHQEILERAVTLAKIAWANGTATQAQSQRNRE